MDGQTIRLTRADLEAQEPKSDIARIAQLEEGLKEIEMDKW